ncbi:MAG: AsmA-like C-terminal domain-containing protein [Burkholderiales bacterium]
MRVRTLLRRILIAVTVIVVLLVVFALSAPLLLAVPSLHDRLEREVSEAAGGQITWDVLYVRLLPRPRAVLRGVHANVPGKVKLAMENAEAFVRLSSLLRGRLEIGSVTLNHPGLELELDLQLPGSGGQDKKVSTPLSDPISMYRAAVEPLVGIVRKFAPDSVWTIEAGSIIVRADGLPQTELRDLSLRARTGYKGFDLDVAAASNSWSTLRLTARVEFADLSGHAKLDVAGLKPQPWLDYLQGADASAGVGLQSADLRIAARSDAKTSIEADIDVEAAALRVMYRQRPLDIGGAHIKGKVIAGAKDTRVDVAELQLGAVVPSARAALTIDAEGQHPRISVDVPMLKASVVRDAVLALAGDDPLIETYAGRIRDGEIRQLNLSTQADSWAGLSSTQQLQGNLTLAGAAVMLPYIDQLASGISAQYEFADNTLRINSLTAELGASKVTDGAIRYALKDGSLTAQLTFDIQVAQAVALARKLLPPDQRTALNDLQSASGRISGNAHASSAGRDWNATIELAKSDAQVRLAQLPWPVALRSVHVSASPRQITVSKLRGAIGASTVDDAAAQLELVAEPRVLGATAHVTLALEQLYPWLRSQKALAAPLQELTTVSGTSAVTLNSLTGSIKRPAELHYDVSIEPRQITATYQGLPAPVSIVGGSVRINRDNVKVDRLGVSFLDAKATLAATIANYQGKQLQATASVSNGSIGQQSMEWVWTRTGAPQRLLPKTPLRFPTAKVIWGPERALDAQLALQLEGERSVAVDLSWRPDALAVRRVHIQDALSNATLSFVLKEHLLQFSFAGTLSAGSVASLFNDQATYPGVIQGDMQLTVDLARQGRARAKGHLGAQGLDLTSLLSQPVVIERLELEADGPSLHIRQAAVNLAQQPINISGDVKRGEHGAVIDAQIDSPGIVLDALLPQKATAEEDPKAETPEPPAAQNDDFFSQLWPLPVVGQIKIHSGFIQYQKRRIEPLSATMTLEENRAQIDVNEANMCGISFPLTVEVLPEQVTALARIRARNQELGDTMRCLSDERVLITGKFDAQVDLTSSGKREDLLRNLKGNVHAEARNGRIMKFGLIGNILSVKSITSLFEKGGPRFDREGFTYRKLVTGARIDAGKVLIEEAALDSDAVGLAATGSINLLDRQSKLTVLVAPFSSVNRIMRKIPIVGYILGGLLTTIPVGVSGDIRDPLVVPLGASAVTSELTGVFTRTLQIPEKLLAPVTGGSQQKKQP